MIGYGDWFWCQKCGKPARLCQCIPITDPCNHRGHADWIIVPKPSVASAKGFCGLCGEYIRPPDNQ